MRQTINRIQHYTVSYYRVVLACGHHRTVSQAELRTEQLFIGKTVACSECQEKTR